MRKPGRESTRTLRVSLSPETVLTPGQIKVNRVDILVCPCQIRKATIGAHTQHTEARRFPMNDVRDGTNHIGILSLGAKDKHSGTSPVQCGRMSSSGVIAFATLPE